MRTEVFKKLHGGAFATFCHAPRCYDTILKRVCGSRRRLGSLLCRIVNLIAYLFKYGLHHIAQPLSCSSWMPTCLFPDTGDTFQVSITTSYACSCTWGLPSQSPRSGSRSIPSQWPLCCAGSCIEGLPFQSSRHRADFCNQSPPPRSPRSCISDLPSPPPRHLPGGCARALLQRTDIRLSNLAHALRAAGRCSGEPCEVRRTDGLCAFCSGN